MLAPPDFVYWLHPLPLFLLILCVVGTAASAIYSLLLLPPVRRASTRLVKINTAVVSVSGGLLGLSMTFLAHSVYFMEDRARDAVNAEARAIIKLDNTLDEMAEPQRGALARLLASYGSSVAAEWPVMATDSTGSEQSLPDI